MTPDNVLCNDTNHTFFSCGRWNWIREQLYANTEEPSSDKAACEMLKSTARCALLSGSSVAKKIKLDQKEDWMATPFLFPPLPVVKFPDLKSPYVGKTARASQK